MTRTDEAMVAAKERPILFSAPMVRAILAGAKTQTRRVVNGMALDWLEPNMFSPEYVALPENHMCPYGAPGDRLWVRETWQDWCPLWEGAWCGHGTREGMATDHEVYYAADEPSTWKRGAPVRWRSPIFMPRWASRITLEITGVRVEQVQDISEDDAEREGVNAGDPYEPGDFRDAFHALWDSINAKRGHGWDVNPWVWVIDFRTVETTT